MSVGGEIRVHPQMPVRHIREAEYKLRVPLVRSPRPSFTQIVGFPVNIGPLGVDAINAIAHVEPVIGRDGLPVSCLEDLDREKLMQPRLILLD